MRMIRPDPDTICGGDDCEEVVQEDDAWVYHHRLGVYVHARCAVPPQTVKGEDISTHTVTGNWSKR